MNIIASIIAATVIGFVVALIVLRPLLQSAVATRRENRLIDMEIRLRINQFDINDLHACLESRLCIYPQSPMHHGRSLAQHHEDREQLLRTNEANERTILRAKKQAGLTLDQIIDRV